MVTNVVYGGSQVSIITHADSKKSTQNARNGQKTGNTKRMLLGTGEISFTAKEQENILALHHDTLVISPTVENCLVKRILVDNGSSTNIIFLAAYNELELEKDVLTPKVTSLIRFGGEVKQVVGKVMISVYAKRIKMSTKFLVIDCNSSYNMIMRCPWIHDMGAAHPLSIKKSNFPLHGSSMKSKGIMKFSPSAIKPNGKTNVL